MRWYFCIDSAEQKALDLCYGNMEMFDGFGDGDGADTTGGGDGFSPNYGTLCGDGFGWGEGHGYFVNSESDFFPNHYGWIDGDGISSQDW